MKDVKDHRLRYLLVDVLGIGTLNKAFDCPSPLLVTKAGSYPITKMGPKSFGPNQPLYKLPQVSVERQDSFDDMTEAEEFVKRESMSKEEKGKKPQPKPKENGKQSRKETSSEPLDKGLMNIAPKKSDPISKDKLVIDQFTQDILGRII